MGMMQPVLRAGHRTGSPWPRRSRRSWTRRDDVTAATRLLALIPSLPRAELSRLTERLIDRMDELDRDPELEAEEDVCSAADDGCGPVFIRGKLVWGAEHD